MTDGYQTPRSNTPLRGVFFLYTEATPLVIILKLIDNLNMGELNSPKKSLATIYRMCKQNTVTKGVTVF